MLNWSGFLSTETDLLNLAKFASGTYSGRDLYSRYKNTGKGGFVRGLLREKGVQKARKLASNAVYRRINTKVQHGS